MKVKSSNSLHFGMSFDFDRTDIRRINDSAFFKLINLSKADKLEFSKLSSGVNSLAIPKINKKGKVESLKIVATAEDRDYGIKSFFIELSDYLKGKKSKFTKILSSEDMTLDNIKQAVNQTTISYKRRWLYEPLKHRIKNITR